MLLNALPVLRSGGVIVPTGPDEFGWLRDSTDALGDPQALRDRMDADGYLYLPGFLARAQVERVRLAILTELARDGALDPSRPLEEGVACPGKESYFRPDIANDSPAAEPLRKLIYGPQMMGFFARFFGEPSRHFDYTWLRAIGPGRGTQPHCDVVYMGRGTHRLVTAWVPFGDVPLEVGGLILKEGSHLDARIRQEYCTLDVDTACENRPGMHQLNAKGFPGFGALADNLSEVRADIGRRWLTAPEFRMGDVLLFSVFTVHGSLDNQSSLVRLSSDSRYQPASEPADERWVGEHPPGHGGKMVRGLIC
jgi:hypothetical protein